MIRVFRRDYPIFFHKTLMHPVLEILASDEGIKEDAPAWCRATGNEFVGMEEKGGEIKVYIKKTK